MKSLSPEALRTAQIQRQHSQEMALRYLTSQKAKASETFDLNLVKATTDWFEEDINDAVAMRDSSVEVTNNGKEIPVSSEEVLTLEQAILLTDKIKGTPPALHPMIKNKMTSMGIRGVTSIDQAVQQLTPDKASLLEDYIDSQIDGGGDN